MRSGICEALADAEVQKEDGLSRPLLFFLYFLIFKARNELHEV